MDFEEETGSAPSGADEPIVALRPVLQAFGVSGPEPQAQSDNPIPRERAMGQVPTPHGGSDQAPLEVAPREDAQIGLDWGEDDQIIYIPVRPIREVDWPNARFRLHRDHPPRNEEPQEQRAVNK